MLGYPLLVTTRFFSVPEMAMVLLCLALSKLFLTHLIIPKCQNLNLLTFASSVTKSGTFSSKQTNLPLRLLSPQLLLFSTGLILLQTFVLNRFMLRSLRWLRQFSILISPVLMQPLPTRPIWHLELLLATQTKLATPKTSLSQLELALRALALAAMLWKLKLITRSPTRIYHDCFMLFIVFFTSIYFFVHHLNPNQTS